MLLRSARLGCGKSRKEVLGLVEVKCCKEVLGLDEVRVVKKCQAWVR